MTLNRKSSDGVLSCADVTVGELPHIPPQCELEIVGQIPLSALNNGYWREVSKARVQFLLHV